MKINGLLGNAVRLSVSADRRDALELRVEKEQRNPALGPLHPHTYSFYVKANDNMLLHVGGLSGAQLDAAGFLQSWIDQLFESAPAFDLEKR